MRIILVVKIPLGIFLPDGKLRMITRTACMLQEVINGERTRWWFQIKQLLELNFGTHVENIMVGDPPLNQIGQKLIFAAVVFC